MWSHRPPPAAGPATNCSMWFAMNCPAHETWAFERSATEFFMSATDDLRTTRTIKMAVCGFGGEAMGGAGGGARNGFSHQLRLLPPGEAKSLLPATSVPGEDSKHAATGAQTRPPAVWDFTLVQPVRSGANKKFVSPVFRLHLPSILCMDKHSSGEIQSRDKDTPA